MGRKHGARLRNDVTPDGYGSQAGVFSGCLKRKTALKRRGYQLWDNEKDRLKIQLVRMSLRLNEIKRVRLVEMLDMDGPFVRIIIKNKHVQDVRVKRHDWPHRVQKIVDLTP